MVFRTAECLSLSICDVRLTAANQQMVDLISHLITKTHSGTLEPKHMAKAIFQ